MIYDVLVDLPASSLPGEGEVVEAGGAEHGVVDAVALATSSSQCSETAPSTSHPPRLQLDEAHRGTFSGPACSPSRSRTATSPARRGSRARPGPGGAAWPTPGPWSTRQTGGGPWPRTTRRAAA